MSGKEGCSSDPKAFRKQAGKRIEIKAEIKTEIKTEAENATKTETKAETKQKCRNEKKVRKRTGKKECNMLSEAMERFIKEHEKEAYDLLLTIAKIPSPSNHEEKKSPVLL